MVVRVRDGGPLFLLMVLVGCGGGSRSGAGGKGGGGVIGAAADRRGQHAAAGYAAIRRHHRRGRRRRRRNRRNCMGAQAREPAATPEARHRGRAPREAAARAGAGGGGGTGGGAVSCAGPDIDIPSALVAGGGLQINGTTVQRPDRRGPSSLRTAGGDVVPLGWTEPGSSGARRTEIYNLVSQDNRVGGGRAAQHRREAPHRDDRRPCSDHHARHRRAVGGCRAGSINGATFLSATDAGVLTLRNGTDVVTLGSACAALTPCAWCPEATTSITSRPSRDRSRRTTSPPSCSLSSSRRAAPPCSTSTCRRRTSAARRRSAAWLLLRLRTRATCFCAPAPAIKRDAGKHPWASYLVKVVPGSYDVYYQSTAAPGVTAPRNSQAKLQSVVVAATGNTTVDIDVPSVVVSGALQINGATSIAGAGRGRQSVSAHERGGHGRSGKLGGRQLLGARRPR